MFQAGLSTLVTYNPSSVSVETTLDELVGMLDQLGFHHWPVLDEAGQLTGMVSEVDILRAVEERHAATMATVGAGPRRADCEPCLARQIMHRRVISVRACDTPSAALQRMLAGQVHSLPVIDEGRLVGIVTSTDFLREFSYGESALSREPATSLMEPPAEPLDVEATLDDANAAFHMAGVDYLPVVQGDFPLGVVSRRSVRKARCRQSARRLLDEALFDGPTTIAQLVAHAPTIVPGARLAKAADLMVQEHLQALAVVNQANRLLGVLSEDRLLHAMLEQAK